jgi:hypothetical protein
MMMSQTMNTATSTAEGPVRGRTTRWGAIIAGGVLAAALGYGAALATTGHLPRVEHPTAATAEAAGTAEVQPAPAGPNAAETEASRGDGSLTGPAVGSTAAGSFSVGTVDPFEAQSTSPQTRAALGVATVPAASAGVQPETVDPFEAQFVSPQLQSTIDGSASSIGEGGKPQDLLTNHQVIPEYR